MIFTLRANRRQVEQAAIKSREEGQTEQQQMWLEWYEQVEDHLPGDTPPPPSLNNGNSNGRKGN